MNVLTQMKESFVFQDLKKSEMKESPINEKQRQSRLWFCDYDEFLTE